MKVYHGSSVKIETIDLSKGGLLRDFGRGFYVTKFLQQAEIWAKRKGGAQKNKGFVTEFVFFESAFLETDHYKTLRFNDYSDEWLAFVVDNRKNETQTNLHDYDIVEGPVANDDIVTRIDVYLDGAISKAEFIEELKFKHTASHQIAFCTQKSLAMIKMAFNEVDFSEVTVDDAVMQSLAVDFQMDDAQATDAFFTSKTYALLIDETTGLHEKPWQEIYEMLKNELGFSCPEKNNGDYTT